MTTRRSMSAQEAYNTLTSYQDSLTKYIAGFSAPRKHIQSLTDELARVNLFRTRLQETYLINQPDYYDTVEDHQAAIRRQIKCRINFRASDKEIEL